MGKRVAFVTIGQSPRDDVVPAMLAEIHAPIDVSQYGALDDMTDAEIASIAPHLGEERLVSRLRDGREVQLGKTAIEGKRLADPLVQQLR
jgi:protein AroM